MLSHVTGPLLEKLAITSLEFVAPTVTTALSPPISAWSGWSQGGGTSPGVLTLSGMGYVPCSSPSLPAATLIIIPPASTALHIFLHCCLLGPQACCHPRDILMTCAPLSIEYCIDSHTSDSLPPPALLRTFNDMIRASGATPH
ncbi:hypothetical protein ES703_24560 [subsurface metagenome]